MISLEAFAMVLLAAAAVYIAFTKCSCQGEEARISWIPELPEETTAEAGSLQAPR